MFAPVRAARLQIWCTLWPMSFVADSVVSRLPISECVLVSPAMKFIVDVAGCWHRVQVVCGGCSRQCAPLAYRAYRRSRVCDNCDLILRHKTQPGFRCHDNASSAAGPLTQAAAARDVEDLCSATIDDELIARNNQPLCSNVSFRGFFYTDAVNITTRSAEM